MIFFSDLDNTLIYSYKKANIDDICVETKDNKKLSFMTPKSYDLLNKIQSKCTFIPVTTRSIEQYCRIKLLSKGNTKYALVCNGAILLKNGIVDTNWHNTSKQLIINCYEYFEKYINLFKTNEHTNFDIRLVDDFFIFTKSNDISSSLQLLKNTVDLELFDIHTVGEKIYIMPKILTKGNAIKRFMKMVNDEYIISAGDSLFDISMLEISNEAIVPVDLNYNKANGIVNNGGFFSDFVLECALSSTSKQN